LNNKVLTKFTPVQAKEKIGFTGFDGKNIKDLGKILESVKVDPTIEVREPPIILKIGGRPVASLGNFSLVIGKAKSKKTFLISSLIATCVNNHGSIENIESFLPENGMILFFDTEQSEYHLWRVVNRICRMTGIKVPVNFNAYGLRKFNPAERLELIEHAIENTPNLALVCIDGLRDLLTKGINDEEEATTVISLLLKWTAEKNIHIILALHQNKNDSNARGHVGTEAVNKAESVLSVTVAKPENISVVEADYMRDIDFEPFAFTIDENGLPVSCDIPEKGTNNTQVIPVFIDNSIHYAVLGTIYKSNPDQSRTTLTSNLKNGFAGKGYKFGDNKARDFVEYYIQQNWIEREPKGKNVFYKYLRAVF
jgi:hypothetical protein